MTKQTNDKGDRQPQQSRQEPAAKRIDQDDRELEKLEREQQKARSGDTATQGDKRPTPSR